MPDKKQHILGVTGGIGSGKSLVGKMLDEQGIPVIDTDHLAHELLNSPNPAYDKVIALFGEKVVTTPGGPIDRQKLGSLVFAYERLRLELNAIMHPAIAELQAKRIEALADHPIVAVLVPLLFESNSQGKYDEIWCITINREVQMARLELRDKATREQILKRINAQWPQERKAEMSDAVIDNSYTKDDTRAQVVKLLGEMRARIAAPHTHPHTDPAVPTTPVDAVTPLPVVSPPAPTDGTPAGDTDTPPAPADTDTPPAPTDGTPAGDADADKNKDKPTPTPAPVDDSKNEFYRDVMGNMARVGSEQALDKLGNIATTQGKESEATMSMVVRSGDTARAGADKDKDGSATGAAASPAPDSERELTVKVQMKVVNRPGTPDEPAPKPDPKPDPQPDPKPGNGRGAPWYRSSHGLLALIALLAFLGFLAYLAFSQHHDSTTVVVNPPQVTNPPVVINNPPVVIVNPPANGGDGTGCIQLKGETLAEPPAFILPYLHNEIRWATAVYKVHYDDGQGYCRNSVVEGRDRLGRLTVRQFYGPHLDYRGQMEVKYFDDGTAQIDRFDSYNIYQGRDSRRVDAATVR